MAGRLVTVAAFASLEQAQAAQAALEAVGIPAAVTDAPPAFALWSYATATGNVRLLVLQEHVERAAVVLGMEVEADGDLDPEQVAAEANAAEEEVEFGTSSLPALWRREPAEPAETERDRWEGRLWFCAFLALMCPPVSLLALALFVKTARMDEAFSPGGRPRFYFSGVIAAMALIFWGVALIIRLTK